MAVTTQNETGQPANDFVEDLKEFARNANPLHGARPKAEVGAGAATPEAEKAVRALQQKQRRLATQTEKKNAAKQEVVNAAATKGLVLPNMEFSEDDGPSTNLCYQILKVQPWGFAFNLLTNQNEFRGDVMWPEHYGRVLTDALANAIRFNLIEVTGLGFSASQVWDSLNALCRANPYDPVGDYLNGLKWDGVSRIDSWLSTYLSAGKDDYTNAVGKLWLMAAVARAFYPGIKFDCVLILEGEQGTQKSTALKVLGGEWFSDAELGDVKDKDAMIQLQGVWIQELAELSNMRRSEFTILKAFYSRPTDKFRAPHDKASQIHPRRSVFGGTCNPGKFPAYLTDPTGNRRMWPVETGKIDIAKLRADRDQLWAEAVHAFRLAIKAYTPENYYRAIELPEKLWPAAKMKQDARLLVDGWVDVLSHWLDNPFHAREAESREVRHAEGGKIEGRTYLEILKPYLDDAQSKIEVIHSRVLLSECLRIPPEKHNGATGKRLKEAMEKVGGWNFEANLTAGTVKGIGGYRRAAETGGRRVLTGVPKSPYTV